MQVVAETLKVLLVGVTLALQHGGSGGGDGGAAVLLRVLLPLLVQVRSNLATAVPNTLPQRPASVTTSIDVAARPNAS